MRYLVGVVTLVVLASCSDGDDAVSTGTAGSNTPATSAATPEIEPAMSTPTPIDESTVAPTTPLTTAPVVSVPATTALHPDAVVPTGFEQVSATVTMADGTPCELCLWLADTDERRARGLMFATELGGPDGMVFRYSTPTTSAFWMKNTVMPLSIAFFAADGSYLGAFDMEPCTADPCATYPTPADFVDAIEVPRGGLPALGIEPGSTLVVHDLPCGGA